jgi:HSP20 family protein
MNKRGLAKHWDRDEFITPFDRVFDKLLSDNFPTFTRDFGVDIFQTSAYPKCDIKDFSDRLEMVFEIPGSTKDNVSIDIDDEVLSIIGNRTSETDTDVKEEFTYIRRELKKSQFKRTFQISKSVFNLDGVSARFDNGMLEITIPKREPTKPTKRVVRIE